MRRFAIFGLSALALALPAAALAVHDTPGDGTLVVKDGSAPRTIAVVTIGIEGTVIGHVSTGSPDQLDTVVINDPNNAGGVAASASAGSSLTRTTPTDQKTKLVGSDFRFRAASGTYVVTVYGSGVDLFAVGHGRVTLQGMPSSSAADGKYSIDGGDWHSLPAAPTDWLPISGPANPNG
jgi:hypothetical protein